MNIGHPARALARVAIRAREASLVQSRSRPTHSLGALRFLPFRYVRKKNQPMQPNQPCPGKKKKTRECFHFQSQRRPQPAREIGAMGSPVHPRTPHLRGTDTPARASHPTNASGRPRVTPSLHLSVRLTDGSDDSDASFVRSLRRDTAKSRTTAPAGLLDGLPEPSPAYCQTVHSYSPSFLEHSTFRPFVKPPISTHRIGRRT